MNDRLSPSEASPQAPELAAPSVGLHCDSDHHSMSLISSLPVGSCIQEWTGSDWVVVDATGCAEGFTAQALDPSRVPGTYLRERVVTACVKE